MFLISFFPSVHASFLARHILYTGHLSVPAWGHRHSRCPSDSAADAYTEGFQHPDVGPVLLLLHSSHWVCPAPWETESGAVVRLWPRDWQRVRDQWRARNTRKRANISQCHRSKRARSGFLVKEKDVSSAIKERRQRMEILFCLFM